MPDWNFWKRVVRLNRVEKRAAVWKRLKTTALTQWFSTFSLKGVKSRLTTLLESRTKEISTQVIRHVLFYSRTKSVTQNIKGFIERVLRAAQRVLGSHMRLSELWLRTTQFVTWHVPRNTHDFWRGKRMITLSSRDHLYVTVLTGFVKGVRTFHPNRQKCPWHWKGCEPLVRYTTQSRATMKTALPTLLRTGTPS